MAGTKYQQSSWSILGKGKIEFEEATDQIMQNLADCENGWECFPSVVKKALIKRIRSSKF